MFKWIYFPEKNANVSEVTLKGVLLPTKYCTLSWEKAPAIYNIQNNIDKRYPDEI